MSKAIMVAAGWLIRDFRLKLRLGWGAAERSRPQPVRFDIELRFPKPPRACKTDRLADTVCYDQATQGLLELVEREFRLLEYLAEEASQILRKSLPRGAKLRVEVTKLNPPILQVRGDIHFYLSDWND